MRTFEQLKTGGVRWAVATHAHSHFPMASALRVILDVHTDTPPVRPNIPQFPTWLSICGAYLSVIIHKRPILDEAWLWLIGVNCVCCQVRPPCLGLVFRCEQTGIGGKLQACSTQWDLYHSSCHLDTPWREPVATWYLTRLIHTNSRAQCSTRILYCYKMILIHINSQ